MSWRKPTIEDITGNLSAREIEAYRRSADIGGDDPVERILSETAELVRSYCRTNGNIVMSPTAGEIPQSLISPAMDYAVFQLLKRMPVQISDARKSAKDTALKIFEDVASGKLSPESYGADVDAGGDVSPSVSVPDHILD